MLDLIKNHLAALASSDWQAFRAMLGPNVVYDEMSSGQRVGGIDAYIASVQRWKKAFPDLRASVMRACSVVDRVILEVIWDGTHAGLLEGAFGVLPPTQRHAKLPAALFITMRDDKIVETRHYYDVLALLRQIGMNTLTSPRPTDATIARL